MYVRYSTVCNYVLYSTVLYIYCIIKIKIYDDDVVLLLLPLTPLPLLIPLMLPLRACPLSSAPRLPVALSQRIRPVQQRLPNHRRHGLIIKTFSRFLYAAAQLPAPPTRRTRARLPALDLPRIVV